MFKKLISIALLVFCTFLVGCGSEDKPFSKLSQDEQKSFAWVMATNAVKEQLKSPSSAKFPSQNSGRISSKGNNKYEISSYVEAKNSLGVMIKNNFTVVLEINEDYNTEKKGYGYNVIQCDIK